MCTQCGREGGREGKENASETPASPEVLPDASGGVLAVTAQLIEAKSASLHVLCRTVIRRAADAAEAAAARLLSVGGKSNCPLFLYSVSYY